MEIVLNGKKEQVSDNIMVLDLLKQFNLNKDAVVVEVNREILSKNVIEKFSLKENDEVEFISFFGGG